MNKLELDELVRKLSADKVAHYERVKHLDNTEYLDEDGYPTEAALELIATWHWCDSKGWLDFIKSIWWASDWGWTEGVGEHDWDKDKEVYRYSISTGGWSGNESIIRAMQKNNMQWHLNWVQSRRGGHYIFELRDSGDDE